MSREIITKKDIERAQYREATSGSLASAPSASSDADDYSTRLLKYVPAEVIAVYLTLEGIIRATGTPQAGLFWGVFIILLILTPLYLWRVTKVTKWAQLSLSTLSFAIWVFTLGGPFVLLSWYQPIHGAILLPLYTFAVPIFEPEREKR